MKSWHLLLALFVCVQIAAIAAAFSVWDWLPFLPVPLFVLLQGVARQDATLLAVVELLLGTAILATWVGISTEAKENPAWLIAIVSGINFATITGFFATLAWGIATGLRTFYTRLHPQS